MSSVKRQEEESGVLKKPFTMSVVKYFDYKKIIE
jgi:hypothetical protein